MTTSVDTLRVTARNSKRQQILELWSQGWSYSAISREVGLQRVTVKRWLQADLLAPNRQEQEANVVNQHFIAEEQLGFGASTSSEQASPSHSPNTPCPPPAPWESWEQVRQIREALQEHRFLLLRRPEHLDADEQVQLNNSCYAATG